MTDTADEADLLRRAASGDTAAVSQLFDLHRERLRWMVRVRLNRRLQGRVDPSDVVQDAYLETSKRLGEYLQAPRVPFFVWLRHLTALTLLAVHRRHLGTQARDARQESAPAEVPVAGVGPAANVDALAGHLVGGGTSPSEKTIRAEVRGLVRQALEVMEPIDREVLVLRHFEMLTNDETAEVLGIAKTAASNRYVRALKRLRGILSAYPGLLDYAKGL